MNILITGTNGFIGKNLKNAFGLDQVIHEVNEDIFSEGKWQNTLLNSLVHTKIDAIFHVGASSNTLEKDVNYMMERNFEFTKMLMDYSSLNGVRFIYSSSAANYGTNNNYPSNLYGWSKYVAEQYVISNGGIGLRYFNVYGPMEEHKKNMASVAYQMFVKYKNGEQIKLFPGKPKRDFVYVNDVVESNLYALKHYDDFKGEYYEVGSGNARTFEEVLDLMNIPHLYHDQSLIPNGYQFFTQSDPNKWMPGWEPKYNLEKGISEYLKYLNDYQ